VIPVFNNFEDTRRLLEALRSDAREIAQIIIVNDASTDLRVLPMLRSYSNEVANALLVENERNLGFVGTCNRGMALSNRDLVILNTDIELPLGAVTRLIRTLRSAPDIATVTPFSNNAYAAGVPDLNYVNDRPFDAPTEAIDRAFQSLGGFDPIDVPRGVGFCMAVSRDVREKLGGFSAEFGQGYGEEADFCMRARRIGYRNVIAPDVYVYHAGGSSFGDTWKKKARAGQLRFLNLHPSYVGLMRTYLADSPSRAVVFASIIALAQQLSGKKMEVLPPASETGRPSEGPFLQMKLIGSRVQSLIIFRGESHAFLFDSPEVAQAALLLAGLDEHSELRGDKSGSAG
jgi:GT2 family glycosyltransferase